MSVESELSLVEAARAGDEAAFAQLVLTYGSLTQRVARVWLFEPTLAEDVAQEVWLDVWRGLTGFDLSRPFRPWLLAIVANRCRAMARRRRLPSLRLDDELAELLPDERAGDAAAPVLQALDYAELRQRLDRLPPTQQQLIGLRFWAELELEEIARLLNQPLSTVKSRLYRTLAALRRDLEASL